MEFNLFKPSLLKWIHFRENSQMFVRATWTFTKKWTKNWGTGRKKKCQRVIFLDLCQMTINRKYFCLITHKHTHTHLQDVILRGSEQTRATGQDFLLISVNNDSSGSFSITLFIKANIMTNYAEGLHFEAKQKAASTSDEVSPIIQWCFILCY